MKANSTIIDSYRPLPFWSWNDKLNVEEMHSKNLILKSKPQRLVLELTNACNLRCIMCGRDEANFSLTTFNSPVK